MTITLEAQNKHLNLILPNITMQKLLRLCYILPLLFILSCGSDKKENITSENIDTKPKEESQLSETSENGSATILFLVIVLLPVMD